MVMVPGAQDCRRCDAAGGGRGHHPVSVEHRWSRGLEGAHSGRYSRVRNVETVRHEAPHDRAEVKGLRRRAVAAARLELRAA